MKRRHAALAVVVVAVIAAAGWASLHRGTNRQISSVTYSSSPATSSAIAELLAQVAVVDKLPRVAGYQRSCKVDKDTKAKQGCVFGPAWNDPTNSSGCDTRQRILRAQLTEVTFKSGTHDCKVLTGLLHDPYSGTEIRFSSSDPMAIEIDHIAALARVWNLGAAGWTPNQRQVFANDPDNLLAVSGPLNVAKSDAGLEWLPPNAAFDCIYIEKYLRVIVKYHLPITRSDRDTAQRVCPNPVAPQPAPAR